MLGGGHDPAVSVLHDPTARTAAHSAVISGLHDAVVSATHDTTVSAAHTPDLSGGHDAVLSASHDPISSTWGGADGTLSVFDFGDLFGTATSQPIVIEDSASAFFELDSPAGLFFSPSLGHGTSPVFFATSLAQEATTPETALGDKLALSLGLQAGAQRLVLDLGAQVIVPADFTFTPDWDAPPVGSIFDLGTKTDGLILAPVGSTLPAGLAGWNQDFFLPGSTTSVKIGVCSVVFTGASGMKVEDFAKSITTGLESILRFDAPTRTWGSYAPVARPSRIRYRR
ncbi:MAG TPA: hypothetical protein QGI71_00235 [Dehalococcoidia bacterium]|nr:hypothetical protein [Dehalococcoidia bacterium]